MRKLKLFSLLCLLMVGVGQVWAAVTALSLPHSWDAGDGKSAYTETLGCTLTSISTDYSSAPKLKFNAAGSTLLIQVADAPDEISFNFKQNGTNAGTFKVQESADGETFTDALTVTWPGNGNTASRTASLNSSTRYIKLVYVTKGNSTNAGVGGISISKASGSTPQPTVSADPTSLDFEVVGKDDVVAVKTFTLTGSDLTDAHAVTVAAPSGYKVSVGANTPAASISISPSDGAISSTIKVTPVTSTVGTFNGNITISSDDLDDDVEVALAMEVKAKYTVTWNNNGATGTSQVLDGAKPVFPATPASCDASSTTFIGWAVNSWSGKVANLSGKTVHTSNATMDAVTADGTVYYAVFAKGTSAPVEPHDGPSYSRSETTDNVTSGYTFTAQAESKSGYYQDGSGTDRYVQVLNTSTPIFSATPSSITVTATIGGGTAGKDLSNPVYAQLLDNTGATIGTAAVVTEHITTNTGDTYSNISLSTTGITSAYGLRISHVKETGYNVRYYSFSLSYTTGGTTYSDYMTTCAAPTCENLGTPVVNVTNKTYNSARLTWAAVDNADKYLVKFNGVDQETTENLYFDATGLEAEETYTYQVKALAEEDQDDYCDGEFSAEANFTTEAAPDYTLTLSENGVTRTFKLAGDVLPKLNSQVNLPTESDQTCEGKVLVGWSTSSVAKTDVAPALVPNPYTLSNATDKAETLYAVYAKETTNKVDGTPVEYDGGGSAVLTALPYVTASGLGSDYAAGNSPYLVKFDTEGDYIQFSLDYAPTSVTFAYKMLGGANTSHVIFKECATADGEYSQVESLEISGAQNSTGALATSETFSQKYVRMVFNKGSNVGIGAITVTGFVGEPSYSQYASVCDPKYTITLANDGNGTAKFDDDATSKDLPEEATAQIIATPAEHYNFTAWTYDSEKVEVADPTSATTTITAKASAATITATFTIKSTHNVTFKSNGNTIGEPAVVYDGETVTLLGAPDVYDENYPYFIGWCASDFKKQATAPTLVTGEEAITEDVTYHAVFGNVNPAELTDDYKKITSDLVSGNYVFAIMAGKAMNAEVSEKVAAGVDVTISEDIISEPAASIIWQVTKAGDNYTLYNADAAKYMNIIADNTYGQLALEDDAAAYTAQFGATNQDIILRSATITGQLIEYYNGYKSYSHSGTAIYAFQQQHATPTEWVTKEVASYQVKYYDNVDGEDIAVPAEDVALDGEDYTVSTTEAVRQGYQFVGWNTDKTASVGIVKVEDVHAAIDLYAIWEANPNCTIHFSVRGDVKAGMDEVVLQGKAYDGFAGKTIGAEDEVEGFTFIGWASATQVTETTSPVAALTTLTPEIQASASEVTVYALYKRTVDNGEKTDVITADDLEATGTSYVPFSNVHKVSNAYYAGGSAYGNAVIQLRSNNSDAGVISTTSGGQIKSVVLDWEEHTDAARVIAVYGKNSAYAGGIAELYNSETQGAQLGEIAVSETTLNVTGEYAYVGIRSKSGALYLNQISITWQDVTNYYTTKPVVIDRLELSGTYPTVFDKGDAFSHEGMTVKAVYSDDAKVDVTADATFSGYDMSTPGAQTVTVSFGGKSTTYSITVNPPTLTSIYLDGTYQTLFAYNSTFNHDGMIVMAVYSDASEADVTSSASFSTPNMVQAGLQDVTVTYETEEAVYAIRVIPANTDYITPEGIGVGTSYEAWSGKNGFGASSVYAGNSMTATGSHAGAIQLRYNTASDKQSGIVLTSSNGLYLKNISVTVNGEPANTLNVYAKAIAYDGYSDLYDGEKCGTLIGTVSETGAITLETGVSYNDNYQYIGLRSASGAIYLDDITITWGEEYVPTVYTVTFDKNDGSATTSVDVNEGEKVAKPEDPIREGYTFNYWTLNNTEYDFDTPVNDDITLVADWTENPAPSTPDYTRNVTNGNYGTICLPKAGTISGAILFDIADCDGSMIYCDQVEGNAMEAGKPYIFKATSTQLNVVYNDNTDEPVAASHANGLYGFYNLENMATDDADQMALTQDAGNYILYSNAYWLVSGREAFIYNFRAYIKLGEIENAGEPAPGRRRVAMAVHGEQVVTDIDAINASEKPMKLMIDGQLFILRGEKMFDATGRLVK